MQLITTKLNEYKPEQILFCSDLHLNHDKEFLWGKRGFISEQEHAAVIKSAWDKYVTDDSVVFHLGDSHFRDGKGEAFDAFSRWKGRIYHLWGNHNSGAKQCFRKAVAEYLGAGQYVEVYPISYNNVTFLGTQQIISYRGQAVFLSHFAHRIWEDMNKGMWHLHGHSHGNDLKRLPDCVEQKALDVGVEVAFNYHGEFNPFFTLNDIRDIMKKKKFVQQDHHDFSTSPSRKF